MSDETFKVSAEYEIKVPRYAMDEDGGYVEGEDALQNHLVDIAARHLVDKLGSTRWGDEQWSNWKQAVRNRVDSIIDDHVEQKVRALVEEVIEEQFAEVDEGGVPTGGKTNVRRLVISKAEKWLTWREDRYGNGSSFTKVVYDQVDRILANEIREEIDAAKEKARNVVRDQASTLIADALAKGIR